MLMKYFQRPQGKIDTLKTVKENGLKEIVKQMIWTNLSAMNTKTLFKIYSIAGYYLTEKNGRTIAN